MRISTTSLKLTSWWILLVHLTQDSISSAKRNGIRTQTNFVACRAPEIKNGGTNIRKSGRKVKYKCFRPYKLFGTSVAYCVNGNWFPPEPPVCVTIGCGKINGTQDNHNRVINGYSEIIVPGAFIKFHCHPGHELKGNDSVYCDGIYWSSVAPACLKTRKELNLVIDFDDCLTEFNDR